MNTYSIFDQDLIARGGAPRFALNRFNFQAAHDFLIPRAVAYSAGMINYFFRGKIDLVPDDSNPGTHLIKNLGNEDMFGTFTLHYDYDDNSVPTVTRRTLYLSWPNVSIPANGQVNIGAISDPTNPAPKNPGEYMLVFKGNMGAETTADFGAVVGKLVNTAFLVFAAFRDDAPPPENAAMSLNLFIPASYAQKFMLNPAGISVQIDDVILPPMVVQASCELNLLECVHLLSISTLEPRRISRLYLTQNNAFAVGPSPVFFGNTPEDLRLISRDTLCTNLMASTTFVVGRFEFLSFAQVKLLFEGKVLFEFVVSPPAADGSVVLTNVKNIRLTEVNCRVSIQ